MLVDSSDTANKCLRVTMILLILVTCISTLFVSGQEEFYITSSSSDGCLEGAECLTLSQFIFRNIYVNYNVTLKLDTGNHTLSSQLFFGRNVVVLTNNHSESNCASRSIITCTQNGHLTFINSLSVVHNIEFRSCLLSMFDHANVNIMSSTFLFGIHGQHQEAYLGYRWGYGKAGVIVSRNSNITLSDCTFERNRAELGAAIFAIDSVIEIDNGSFVDNQAICEKTKSICLGGVLYSYNSTIIVECSNFHNNSASYIDSQGGVFTLLESSVHVSNSHFTSNVATHGSGGVIYAQRTYISIIASVFVNNTAARYGGVIRSSGAPVTDNSSHYEGNTAGFEGGVIFLEQAILTFTETKFFFNNAKSIGGAVRVYIGTLHFYECEVSGNNAEMNGGAASINRVHLTIRKSNFTSNKAIKRNGGAIQAIEAYNITILDSIFSFNKGSYGGVLYSEDPFAMVLTKFCVFISNSASVGGVIYTYQATTTLFENCTFSNNSASESGGVLSANGLADTSSNLTVAYSIIESSFATQGGVVYATNNAHIHMHDVTVSDNVATLGIMYFIESMGTISGYADFSTNIGSLFAYNSNITITGDATFVDSYPSNTNHTVFSEGGAITAFQSDIILHGLCKFDNNFAESGGAVRATESQVYITGSTTISNSTAGRNGGGIFLYQSELKCEGDSILSLLGNVAGNKGGAIHAISSSIKTNFIEDFFFSARSQIYFIENHAHKGGAVSLEVNAKLYIFIKVNIGINKDNLIASLTFTRNEADYGGAMYVADGTNSGICASASYHIQSSSTECFLQALGLHGRRAASYTYVNFTNNTGKISGATLYGGLLDRCTVSPFGEIYSMSHRTTHSEQKIISGVKYFETYSNIKRSSISSKAVRTCFCKSDHLDCDYQPSPVRRKKGERFEITLAAVDQIGNPLSNANVLSSLSSNLGGLGVNQSNQTTAEGCTTFHYEVFSPHAVEELNIHAAGPCNDAVLSQRKVLINFTDCECPIGFQPKVSDKTNCVCECDSELATYIESCDFETASFIRKGNPWISYVTSSDNLLNGYLIYPHCPLDYCFPPGSNVLVDINKANGSDAQCQHERSGLLCGACKPELSLSLGTIHCISCPSYWPALLVVQLIGSLIAGIVLVMAVLILNLTVAHGTINGIIFYVNILYNFIPSFISHSRITFSSVFVSLLNLELGFDSCFFEGMDAFSKTWIELLFPTYVVFLVIMIILVSEWSKNFSHLIGKRNPVATLATLILFSYAKLLNIIIKALSFAIISYPGLHGPTKTVRWLPDASVEYFKGKHIPLGVTALFLLLLCVIFTVLVFFWQWLSYFDDNKLLKLIKRQKMSHFIETYQAPYTPRNRYWTGLLLIVRIILYVASSINVSGNPNVNLLIIGLVIVSVLFLKEISGINSRIYKKWPIEILEISIHINIVVLCISSIFANVIENENAKEAITNTSVAIVFLQFLGILSYHIFTEIITKTQLWKMYVEGRSRLAHSQEELGLSVELSSTAPTSSVIEKPKRPASEATQANTDLSSQLREPLLEQSIIQ